MIDAASTTDPLDDLTEEFARRWREGERPSIEEYAARFPQWAEDIRELFPAILLMEQLKPRREDQPTDPSPPVAGPIPERLGDYRILREIGRGGMGVVYEAEQETLGRRVAIKVLPGHLLSDEKLRARFRRESQAAARLHHTNIVPVFDVGEQDGLHYYAMQLIVGLSIDAVLAAVNRQRTRGQGDKGTRGQGDKGTASTTPSPCPLVPLSPCPLVPLSAKEVARLGVQVADALAYAHAQGVLHRDVKPSNLLLDEQGTVWVTDFGVAKLVEEANLTGSGDLVGTLRYMPPERFSGTSDARGDVYSLGITLYEMLARRPAFPDTTPQHLIQLITQADLPSLRKFDPTVPTDLETVILKAAARDPAYRYQTAAELSDDLRRFLDDRPIKARRTRVAEQVWRWCRRNRLAAGFAAAAVVLLMFTTLVSLAAYVRTSAANQQTETANNDLKRALGAEQTQRERAENTSAAALEAMNRIYDRFAPNRIIVAPSLPADGSSEDRIDLPPQPILSPEAVPLLEELLEFYEQFAREGSDRPRLQTPAAEAEQRIGDIRQRLGQLEPAIAAYRQALELYAHAPAEGRSETIRIKVARTYNELGRALWALQRTDEARDAHGHALTMLTEAPKECAARPECRYELARTYYLQSQREFTGEPPGPPPGPKPDRGPGRGPDGGRGPEGPGRGRPPGPDDFGRGRPPGPRPDGPPPGDGERQTSRRAIELLEGLVKDHPNVPEYRHLLACCYRDAPPRGPRSVEGSGDPAVKLLRQLVKDFPKVPDYRYDLCETLARRSMPGRGGRGDQESRRQLEEAVVLSASLVDEYPNVPLYAVSRALVYDRLGSVLEQLDQREEAERHYRKGIALLAALVRQHPEVAAYDLTLSRIQRSLARLLTNRKDLKEARAVLEASANRLDALLKKAPRVEAVRFSLGSTQRDLAEVLTRLGEHELAAKALRKAEELGPERKRRPD
jgi:eukaryotic-like serine/threonine-protein kinase